MVDASCESLQMLTAQHIVGAGKAGCWPLSCFRRAWRKTFLGSDLIVTPPDSARVLGTVFEDRGMYSLCQVPIGAASFSRVSLIKDGGEHVHRQGGATRRFRDRREIRNGPEDVPIAGMEAALFRRHRHQLAAAGQRLLHDALYLRDLFGLKRAPEFDDWLVRVGLAGTDFRLAGNAGQLPDFAAKLIA